ncbi:MAG: preprotein translocase subunit SecG [Patescibacteria group bacterium]
MMSTVQAVLPYVQIALAVVLAAAILLQRSEAGLGAGFGADSFSTAHRERRGFEKTLFISTIVIALLFVASTVVSLLIQ